MYKFFMGLFFYLFIIAPGLYAQVIPAESSALNYRIIGFMAPKGQAGSKYTIEIAAGNYNNTDSFKQNIITTRTGDKNKIIAEVPAFGAQYTWCVTTKLHDKATKGPLHHFSTMSSPAVDTAVNRLRITANSPKYKDHYIFMDGNKALYDMNGRPVWFLPSIEGKNPNNYNLGDMKLTKQNTITYLTNRTGGQAYEVDYKGNVLWKAPNNGQVSGDSQEHYHHEFTRLDNGNYMIMGSEGVEWELPGKVDSSLKHAGNKNVAYWNDSAKAYYERMQFATLIEFDNKGKIVWSWKSSTYFKGSDIFSGVSPRGTYYINDVHANSFSFDKKTKAVYVSFKGISRIVKVQYPSGNVVDVYGKKHDHFDLRGHGPSFFTQQHDCHISKEGYLYLFNNNDHAESALPILVMMKMPVTGKDSLTKVWDYTCVVDGVDSSKKKRYAFSNGGSVYELPDGSLFSCMSRPDYTKVFIVTRKKREEWSALPEAWNQRKEQWEAIVEYKASIITKAELEQLIWNLK